MLFCLFLFSELKSTKNVSLFSKISHHSFYVEHNNSDFLSLFEWNNNKVLQLGVATLMQLNAI